MSIFNKLFSITSGSGLRKYESQLAVINGLSEEVAALSDDQIRAEIRHFKDELKTIEDEAKVYNRLLEIRPRVFALTREASKRARGQFHYDVQIIGGLVLSEGRIAEMKTGEGKTLTATLPLVLFALAGRGAHLVTVNDYLARWQASDMGKVYSFLGLSVASIQHEASFLYDESYQPEQDEIDKIEAGTQGLTLDVKHMRPITRQEAYRADITYGTNNEFGFDYLRDNMVQSTAQLRQRDLFYAIVDEVDSILIDEARTPLIISQPDSEPTDKYYQFAKIVDQLQEQEDYIVDEKHKAVNLTDEGITKVEKILNVQNIYDTSAGVTTLHHIEQALRAKTLYKRDRDYVIRDGEVVIVDEFTGRLMFGRRYSQGLHQAIEAKENVKIQQESKTLATITFQNLFRLYSRLAGMTGTAKTEEEEFFKIYQLEVCQIPTNKPMIRIDMPDLVFKNESGKFAAIVRDVKERHKKGQPVLIGTVSIAKNELLANELKKAGIPFEVLNAKNHEREAQIIAQAGRYGAVTVATNIAGRGVDILLGGNPVDPEEAKKVREAGGLAVIGTERHESRRIDNQLRGRAGRQGDPGSSQFYVSMEDDLMRLFGGARMQSMMETLKIPDDQPIEAKMISRSIESAQKKIEGLNFDTRKSVLEFDDVLNHQRKNIYSRRRRYLAGAKDQQSIKNEILESLKARLAEITSLHFANLDFKEAWEQIALEASAILPNLTDEKRDLIFERTISAADREFVILDELNKLAEEAMESKSKEIGEELYENILRSITLQAIDRLWMEHLDTMDHLRDSVRLRGYGMRDPLVEYKKEGHLLFQRLLAEIDQQILSAALRIGVQTHTDNEGKQHYHATINLTGGSINSSAPTPIAEQKDPRAGNIGRNDPCFCGSGKKYKKCGLANTVEHQQNLLKQ